MQNVATKLICLIFLSIGIGMGDSPAQSTTKPLAKIDAFTSLNITSSTGQKIDPLRPSSQETRGMVYVFTLSDCPIANAYSPEISRISKQYNQENFDFYLIHTDPGTTRESAGKHAKEYGLDLNVCVDTRHELVKLLKAESVPEAFIMTPNRQVVYRGRIDDRNTAYGKRRAKPSSTDLRDALDAIIQGKPVPVPVTEVIGCYVPPLPEK